MISVLLLFLLISLVAISFALGGLTLAVIGFVVVLLLGLSLIAFAICGTWYGLMWSGRLGRSDAITLSIVFLIGGLLVWFGVSHAPFTIKVTSV